eukprot:GFUD01122559.1.p1 GENE.GFUD01122559.1~~GFUD01122559.1.p1  ORF type:complete len:549 (-),score=146.92 GFUD01122559.1:1042-2688(-)
MSDPKNPFVHSLTLSSIQLVKVCVLSVILLPIRLLIALICLTLATILAVVGLKGLEKGDIDKRPFTGWRLAVRNVICYILRFMFFCSGFSVKIVGKQASPEDAPILAVAPHSSFFDALAVCVMGAPSVVAKAETSSIPFWGSLIKYTQPVLVHRLDTNSRLNTIKQITERSEGRGWQQVQIFPEGTCTNRSCLITFRLGAFYPGVAVQPVLLKWDNMTDCVTWTWEGIEAWRIIVYTLSQFYTNLTIEYLPPYNPTKEEVQDPKLFAANIRAVMADSLGVTTTDCNYLDYLRIDKSRTLVKRVQKLQKKMEMPLIEATSEEKQLTVNMDLLGERLGVAQDLAELSVVEELCGKVDLRNLRLVTLLATEEDALETFLAQTFILYNPELGPDKVSSESLEGVLSTVMLLNQKEAKEAVVNMSKGEDDLVVDKKDLADFLLNKKPNYVKVLRCWEMGLTEAGMTAAGMGDLLAMSASLTKEMNRRMEKVAESGSNLLSAGKEVVSDVSATITASRDKVTDVLSSAVTSLHKRTGSGNIRSKSETLDNKKLD